MITSKKTIWLLKDGSPLPTEDNHVRLLRVGLLAEELSQRGHDVTWWTSTFNHHKKELIEYKDATYQIKPNYQIKLLHAQTYEKNISFQRIRHNQQVADRFELLASQYPKPDLILAAIPTIELAYAATVFGKQHDIPVIIDLRDMWPDIMVDIFPKYLQPFAKISLHDLYQQMTLTCHNATSLIGITDEFLQWGLRYANRPKTQLDTVFPHGYLASPPPESAIQKANEFWDLKEIKNDGSSVNIIFLGSTSRSHQIDNVIDAVGNLPKNFKLIIGGHQNELKKYIEITKENSKIILAGWLDRAQIYTLLRRSHLGIAPYLIRQDFIASIPNKIIEYLSAGLPVLTCLPGVTKELLLNNQCGAFYEANNTHQLTELILHLAQNPAKLADMSNKAKALFSEKFTAERVYKNMADHLISHARSIP